MIDLSTVSSKKYKACAFRTRLWKFPFGSLYELVYRVVELLKLRRVGSRTGDAVLYMILEDYLGRIVQRGTHGGKLDKHLRAVAPVLDHALDGLKMPDGAGKAVDDGLRLRVAVHMPVAVRRAVDMDMIMYLFLWNMHTPFLLIPVLHCILI